MRDWSAKGVIADEKNTLVLKYGTTILVKPLALLALATTLSAQPDAGRNRLDELNRQADVHFRAYEFDRAEPLLEQALELAINLGPSAEAAARIRIVNLYLDLVKRDGHDWRNLVIPHIRRALDLKSTATVQSTNGLAVQLAINIMELPSEQNRPALNSELAKGLDQWIAQLEWKDGPLNPQTALPYEALTYAANGSEGKLRALNACELLAELPPPPPEFAMVLIHCAEHELHMVSEENTRRFIRLARAAAAAGGPRYAYETVLSYIGEAELEGAVGTVPAAIAAIESARDTARKFLSATHELWERIDAIRGTVLPHYSPSGQTKRELVHRGPKSSNPRLQPAKILSQTAIEYTKQARVEKFEGATTIAILVSTDGKGSVINTYRGLPFDLGPNLVKAISGWTFQPWLKDGKPVPGVGVFEILIRPPTKAAPPVSEGRDE